MNTRETANGHDQDNPNPDAPETTADDAEPRKIELEIETVRADLSDLTGELDRRRHAAVDVQLQARQHPVIAVVATTVGVLTLIGWATWLYRQLRPDTPAQRARKLARALGIATHDPDKLLRTLENTPDPRASVLSSLLKLGTAAGQRAITHGA